MRFVDFQFEGLLLQRDRGDEEQRHEKRSRPRWLRVVAALGLAYAGVYALETTPIPDAVGSSDPAGIDFGLQGIGAASPTQRLTITSKGNSPLRIRDLAFHGPQAGEFSIVRDDCSHAFLPPDESCVIGVRLVPREEGCRKAELIFTGNAGAGPMIIGLHGIGTRPAVPVAGIKFDPMSVSFDIPDSISTRSVQTVTLISSGNADLHIFRLELAGDNSTDFIMDSGRCSGATLPPGARCPIQISFSPAAAGTRQAVLIVADNTSGSPHTVPISGRKNPPPAPPATPPPAPPPVKPPPPPIPPPPPVLLPAIAVDPASLNFGDQEIRSPSKPVPIKLLSTGRAPLVISSVSHSGLANSDFLILNDRCTQTTWQPGRFCRFDVQFIPLAAGSRTATLHVFHNATPNPQPIHLRGNGLSPSAGVSASPNPADFGERRLNQQGETLRITLRGTGSVPVRVARVTLEGQDRRDFHSTTKCKGQLLAVGNTCQEEVRFSPRAAGSRGSTLTFLGPAGERLEAVELRGFAIEGPSLVLTPGELNLQSRELNAGSTPQTVTLAVRGSGTLTIQGVSILEGGNFVQTVLQCEGWEPRPTTFHSPTIARV